MKQYYTNNGYLIINGSKCFMVNPDRLSILEDIAKTYDPLKLNTRDLVVTFPEAKKYLKEKLKTLELKQQYLKRPDYAWSFKEFVHSTFKTAHDREIVEWLVMEVYINLPSQQVEDEIKQTKNMLYLMGSKEKLGSGDILAEHIAEAKLVPLDNFMKFNQSGFAPCCWHQEKSPSMKYYKKTNSVHCFGCNKGGDVIDLVSHLYNLKFLDAVKFILNK